MKIVSDHGFPKDGADALGAFANEREYIKATSRNGTTVAAMDWAYGEILRLRTLAAQQDGARDLLHECREYLQSIVVGCPVTERSIYNARELVADIDAFEQRALTK